MLSDSMESKMKSPSKPSGGRVIKAWAYMQPRDNELHFSIHWPFWVSEADRKSTGMEPIEVELREIRPLRTHTKIAEKGGGK